MTERWKVLDTDQWLNADAVVDTIDAHAAAGQLTTWLESDRGRSIAWVTNRERVMLMLIDHEGDAGEHAVDPGADGESDGYILENGQADIYANRDTVPVEDARVILRQLITTGRVDSDVNWQVDR